MWVTNSEWVPDVETVVCSKVVSGSIHFAAAMNVCKMIPSSINKMPRRFLRWTAPFTLTFNFLHNFPQKGKLRNYSVLWKGKANQNDANPLAAGGNVHRKLGTTWITISNLFTWTGSCDQKDLMGDFLLCLIIRNCVVEQYSKLWCVFSLAAHESRTITKKFFFLSPNEFFLVWSGLNSTIQSNCRKAVFLQRLFITSFSAAQSTENSIKCHVYFMLFSSYRFPAPLPLSIASLEYPNRRLN